jgi:hypothetical protein
VPANKQLQRTVSDKVPIHLAQRAAAELRRYTAPVCGLRPQLRPEFKR